MNDNFSPPFRLFFFRKKSKKINKYVFSNKTETHPVSLLSLQSQLSGLTKRLERVQETLKDDEGESYLFQNNKQVFFPFTIRDAQRTVPTQIPYGFEVFDFIDLYKANQNQTTQSKTNQKSNSDSGDDTFSETISKSSLYRNGKPLANPTNITVSECQGYSKKCYRSKFLKVIRYLLDLKKNDDPKSNNENNKNDYYYFYMEADNDLCVPLSEICDLALEHQRYFVSTGTGASGWIMSHRFLEDFYELWNSMNDTESEGDQFLKPDSVAARLLREKMNWSVTRQYLTSHSILKGTTNDEISIGTLFERADSAVAANKNSNANTNANAGAKGGLKTSKRETPEEASKKAPLMEPSRYLPRCLEPHRGVWKDTLDPKDKNAENKENNSNVFDDHHWMYFDYDLCPNSEIFPCAEGQLQELAKKEVE